MRIFAFVTVIGLAAGFAPSVHGQSLADVARKEQERRQAGKSGTKVYTNGDLKTPSEPESNPAAAASGAADSATADKKPAEARTDAKTDAKGDEKAPAKDAKAADKGDKGDKDQAYWSARMKQLNDQLERDRLYAEAIQTRINSLTADFSAKDDPVQRGMIGQDRDKALAELERLRKQIEEDKDAIGNAEEEARHTGVPPGWLR
jgi:hypothetical protein